MISQFTSRKIPKSQQLVIVSKCNIKHLKYRENHRIWLFHNSQKNQFILVRHSGWAGGGEGREWGCGSGVTQGLEGGKGRDGMRGWGGTRMAEARGHEILTWHFSSLQPTFSLISLHLKSAHHRSCNNTSILPHHAFWTCFNQWLFRKNCWLLIKLHKDFNAYIWRIKTNYRHTHCLEKNGEDCIQACTT